MSSGRVAVLGRCTVAVASCVGAQQRWWVGARIAGCVWDRAAAPEAWGLAADAAAASDSLAYPHASLCAPLRPSSPAGPSTPCLACAESASRA